MQSYDLLQCFVISIVRWVLSTLPSLNTLFYEGKFSFQNHHEKRNTIACRRVDGLL